MNEKKNLLSYCVFLIPFHSCDLAVEINLNGIFHFRKNFKGNFYFRKKEERFIFGNKTDSFTFFHFLHLEKLCPYWTELSCLYFEIEFGLKSFLLGGE